MATDPPRRHEAFRERQINAADDFSTGLLQALLALRDAWSTSLKHGFMDEQQRLVVIDPATGRGAAEITEAFERAERAIAEVQMRHARIALLFGRYEASPRRGQLAIMELRSALDSLSSWPHPDLDRYHEYERDTQKSLDSFNDHALADIEGRPWYSRWRMALWLRRRIRRISERLAERRAGRTESATGTESATESRD